MTVLLQEDLQGGDEDEEWMKDDVVEYEEEEDTNDIQTYLPVPPDGGWGWVVVFASFMIHVFADGFTYTFGIFYVHILNYYGVSKSSASWIASILVGVTLGSGPLSGTLVNRFGCRIVTIVGAILASFSLFISIYASSVVVLYVTIGFGTGLGFGLIYLPAIISVTGYFEKKRSFATGIAVCGSGIGTFAFSPFTEYLIDLYGWKGALIIISALMLNCVVFGALFRPLEVDVPSRITITRNPESNGGIACVKSASFHQENNVSLADIPTIKITNSPSSIPPHLASRLSADGEIPRNSSHSYLESRLAQLRKLETDPRLSSSQPFLANSQNCSTKTFGSLGSHGLGDKKRSTSSSLHSQYGSGLLNRRDIFYGGSLLNIEQYKQDPLGYRSSMLRIPDFEEASNEVNKSKVCGCMSCSQETRETLNSLMDWSLMSDGIFLLFIFSNFCTSVGFNAPYIFSVDRALEMGIGFDQASYLLSIIGISNTVSRVVLGYISDKSWVNRLYLYNTALTACGIGVCISNWLTGFGGQAFYAAVFGSMSGAYVGLTSVVLVDLLGMEKLTNAFGLLLLFQGIASLIGPPVCGALYDMSKSYDYSFLFAGFMIGISGLMLFFIPCVYKVQARKQAERTANHLAE